MYKVIQRFRDLKDNSYIYKVNDIFPRKGVNVTPERIKELAGSANKTGKPLIVKIEEEKTEKKETKKNNNKK